jgi:glucose/arabinose dehydrogenase
MGRTNSYRLSLLAVALLLAAVLGVGSPAEAQAPKPSETDLTEAVQVPDGFEATRFAGPPQVNYPTAITPSGTTPGVLFVAVDPNGSLDQKRGRGQVLRIADTDGDGRADHFTTFVDSVESPRGLVYDGETLYVMHPPQLTAYRDTDGDGRADQTQPLVRGLGFGLDFRGADHTTNGIQMGIDGWIYVAVGDYGIPGAVGTDGTRLKSRAGGIVRVRPDGSELEMVAHGLRNVYDIALGPYLNGFVRGNTNDGGGWDVRLNRILLGADYGYPTLYKNFPGEAMPPLADYGGGSGTGAYFLHEPNLPDSLAPMLYTVDWGRSAVYRHPMKKEGATFQAKQKRFLMLPAPTDFTADGDAHLYVSSWFKGGFRYSGEDVGFVVRLTPSGQETVSLPAPAEADPDALIRLLGSGSALHRLQAQREILRRGRPEAFAPALKKQAAASEEPLYARIAAIFTLKQLRGPGSHDFLLRLARAKDETRVQAFALRALSDRKSQLKGVPTEPFVEALAPSRSARVRVEAVTGLARLGAREAGGEILPLTASPDPVLSHIAVRALTRLGASQAALSALRADTTSEALRAGALQVLRRLHSGRVVTGLMKELAETQAPARRQALLETLARLYHRAGAWDGQSWWGTQPDSTGPYYEPVTWAQSERMRPVLRQALQEARGASLDTLLATYERNRVLPAGAGRFIADVARRRPSLKAALAGRLVGQKRVSEEVAPYVARLARRDDSLQAGVARLLVAQPERSSPPEASLRALRRAASNEALPENLRREALAALSESAAASPQARGEATRAFAQLGDPKALPDDLAETWRRFVQRAEHAEAVGDFVALARKGNAAEQTLAYTVLLKLARLPEDNSNEAANAARKEARTAIEAAWKSPPQTVRLLRAIGFAKAQAYADRVRALLDSDQSSEAPPEAVRQAAAFAAERVAPAEASTGDASSE